MVWVVNVVDAATANTTTTFLFLTILSVTVVVAVVAAAVARNDLYDFVNSTLLMWLMCG